MKKTYFKNWWLLIVKGLLVILFGIFAFTLPEDTLIMITVYFGLIVLITGLLTISVLLFNLSEMPRGVG